MKLDRGAWIMLVGVLIAGFGRGVSRGLGAGITLFGLGVAVIGLVVFWQDS